MLHGDRVDILQRARGNITGCEICSLDVVKDRGMGKGRKLSGDDDRREEGDLCRHPLGCVAGTPLSKQLC